MSALPRRTAFVFRYKAKANTVTFSSSCRRREFHDYFVTQIPSSSLHPDSRPPSGPHHRLPRDKSVPHTGTGRSPAAAPPAFGGHRETTVVRIPLRSAKHHFGATFSRGQRPYNEDRYQAGTIELPAFAKKAPVSLTGKKSDLEKGEVQGAESSTGDPQVFYFGIFDGHGGQECSDFLTERLHEYIEDGAKLFGLKSTLRSDNGPKRDQQQRVAGEGNEQADRVRENLDKMRKRDSQGAKDGSKTGEQVREDVVAGTVQGRVPDGEEPLKQLKSPREAEKLERDLITSWKETVGGYFKRFKPDFFSLSSGGKGHTLESESARGQKLSPNAASSPPNTTGLGIETVLTYSFLRADLDFVSAQARKGDPAAEDSVLADRALNEGEVLHFPSQLDASRRPQNMHAILKQPIGGPKRFEGGSTASVALVSTPTSTPFWNPAAPSTIVTAHCGDTRILLCATETGLAIPLTTNHHPSSPVEATRLRRYATTFVTDSFGEERMGGLANTRAFGDVGSKRLGVSAEPEIRRLELRPAEYSFIVLMTDGISGTLSDQEIVDIVKEAKTPEQASRDVVSFATEVSQDGDNATCVVVRMGGWERRTEGGVGSMGTKEMRDFKREEANNPRAGRR